MANDTDKSPSITDHDKPVSSDRLYLHERFNAVPPAKTEREHLQRLIDSAVLPIGMIARRKLVGDE